MIDTLPEEFNRLIFTEDNFDEMSWNECEIYALSLTRNAFEFVIDLDYIVKCERLSVPADRFRLWVAPATLVFENVHSLEIETQSHNAELTLESIIRENPKKPANAAFIERDIEWKWTLCCQEGEITFGSIGFKMYLRRLPVSGNKVRLGLEERGGASFYRGLED